MKMEIKYDKWWNDGNSKWTFNGRVRQLHILWTW
jgi:hypothetical protein